MEQKFDYKGLSAETLEAMCSSDYGKCSIANDKYWTSVVYSMGQFIREYAHIHPAMPLDCYSEHGVSFDYTVYPHEINNDASLYLCYNSVKQGKYKKNSKKPCFIVPAPMPWLRKEHNLQKSPTAQGTLAYFQHTTPEVDFLINIEKVVDVYVAELQQLPDYLNPICVCLAMHDIHKGYHNLFMERSIPVYTAGNVHNNFFYKEFYDLMHNFSYTTSSVFGSNTFYSIEANIPFFLYGTENLYYNVSDQNLRKGVLEEKKSLAVKNFESLLRSLDLEINEKQRTVADALLGKKDNVISRDKLHALLMKSL